MIYVTCFVTSGRGGTTLLTRNQPTLPSSWYYDPARYGRELDAVWYRERVCIGRREELPGPGDVIAADIGTHHVTVTREPSGRLDAKSDAAAHVDTWGGFIFVNLAGESPAALRDWLGGEADVPEQWPLDRLRSVHREQKLLACNWKVFWENY